MSADRVILATASDFTPDSLTTVDQCNNLELLDGVKITLFLGQMQLMNAVDVIQESKPTTTRITTTSVSSEQITQYVNETVQKRTKGGFMDKEKNYRKNCWN